MTLGIRPEHIALSSRRKAAYRWWSTLEILGADNLAMGVGVSKSWWCGWRISIAEGGQYPMAASASYHLHLLMAKQDNAYE